MLTIKQRQLNLKTYMYYYKGEIDGIEGVLTIDAYINFQKNNCLNVDGIYGKNTDNKLILCIKDVQKLLNKFNYNLNVDGIVGNKTIESIKDFQSKNNLIVDGIVGNETYKKLGNYMGTTITWNSIKYFKKSEFTCQCGCNINNVDIRLVKILDSIREHFNSPLIITSACRCTNHNTKIGGALGSRHINGKAADFYVEGVSTGILLSYTKQLVSKGVIRYTYTNSSNMNGVVHIDII